MASTAAKKSKKAGKKASAKHTPVQETSAQADAAPPFENPLVPHAVLRQMFQKMVEARVLEGHLLGLKRKSKGGHIAKSVGQEACRVSLVQGLSTDDVVLDSQPGEVMQHLLGASLAEILGGPVVENAAAKKPKKVPAASGGARLLPFVKGAEERIFAGIGAAIMLKHLKRTDVAAVFVESADVSKGLWRKALTLAGTRELPIIFVVLPAIKFGKVKSESEISALSTGCGVPGVPVDASDAVALYRVVQESIGRIRAGGGAVLIEGIPFPAPGEKSVVLDPLDQMKGYMTHRRVSPAEWFANVEADFRKRLISLKV
jgi:TPP-dependent pyruvate/acetoin dehydrogenase alpha subunit